MHPGAGIDDFPGSDSEIDAIRDLRIAPSEVAMSGAVIWGRVRKIGTGGGVGGWSDPAKIRVG
jgi:hypothetical protein